MAEKDCILLPVLNESDITRYWKYLVRGRPDECWLWKGTTAKGYGTFGVGPRKAHRMVYAHRIAYFLEYGVDPAPFWILHRCDTPLCCNPAHLWRGTAADNIRDCISKGRFSAGDAHYWRRNPEAVLRGERNGGAKLTEADIVEIRRLYDTGLLMREIAVKFGVGKLQIGLIVNRKHWKHVPSEEPKRPRWGDHGETHHVAKLKDADIVEIRALYASGSMSQYALAEKFGVTQGAIHYIVARKTWRHIP